MLPLRRGSLYPVVLAVLSVTGLIGARAVHRGAAPAAGISPAAADPQVLHGRFLVVSHACGACHGGGSDPSASGWLQGQRTPEEIFEIGPCYVTPGAQPCFHTRPRNLTPDNATGLGRFSERQIFNALRYGLRPEDTPDVKVTSTTPGVGNFPTHPHYLAPPMPWPSWRYMPDRDLWAIAAYLKRGLKPVHHLVPESEGPPDFWASAYTAAMIGPYPPKSFPTVNEVASKAKVARRK